MTIRKIIVTSIVVLLGTFVYAQTPLKKVYDETINPIEQIDQALSKAKGKHKYIVCQVGGNWCPWCLRFADFITKDQDIAQLIAVWVIRADLVIRYLWY